LIGTHSRESQPGFLKGAGGKEDAHAWRKRLKRRKEGSGRAGEEGGREGGRQGGRGRK